ncbi:hypothetical protein PLUTO_00120 [Luteibacter phage vB_LflM-Pluto]|uniref:Tail protein n=1 Tax=Luteibacter phage vB_LflM-Pluto TaxID=2948611 RepID=A0A9E7SL72_9CAUD|nr:hypothetical protein PLUTO_00120 [Luteibacter phage vB_LflM-Pluto]
MQNISGYGLVLRITASVTFPNGFDVTAFADDADAIDSPDITIADTGMGLNGDMTTWSRPQPIELAVAVIPNTDDDTNLGLIHEANRVAKGKSGARDLINIAGRYPSGKLISLSNGIMIVGPSLPSVANAGRIKTRTFRFRFENIANSGQ